MANTSSIQNAPSLLGEEKVASTWMYAAGKFRLQKSEIESGNVQKATYVYAGGPVDVTTTLVLRHSVDNKGVQHMSVTLNSINIVLDGNGDEVSRSPVSFVLAINKPFGELISHAEIFRCGTALMAALYGDFNATASGPEAIDAMARGLVEDYPWYVA